jgi:hypothetical protein
MWHVAISLSSDVYQTEFYRVDSRYRVGKFTLLKVYIFFGSDVMGSSRWSELLGKFPREFSYKRLGDENRLINVKI